MNKYFKEINGTRTEIIESHGVGTPVFIFHGNSSGASAYVDLLQSEVGDTYKLIAVSFMGTVNLLTTAKMLLKLLLRSLASLPLM